MPKIDVMLAKKYAKAYLVPEPEKKDLQQSKKRMGELTLMVKKLSSVKSFFENQSIPVKIKKEVVGKIFPHHNQTPAFKLIELLISKHQADILDSVVEEADNLMHKLEGLQTAVITCAFDMDKKTLEKIRSFIEEKTGKKTEIKTDKNPDILGGFQIKVEDKFMDASISGKLNELKKSLTN